MPSRMAVKARNTLRRAGVEVVPTRGRREVSLLALHLQRVFWTHGVDVVLDVGARIGEYGSWLRQNGYAGWIVSFEPVAESVRQLRERAAADDRWLVFPFALGEHDERGQIHVAAMSQLSSLREPSEYGSREYAASLRTDHIEEVQVRRLDAVWSHVLPGLDDPRVYLKLDTQGWDLQVLRGAGHRIRDVVGVQTEASVQGIYAGAPTHLESIRALQDLGFTVSGMFPVTLDSRLRLVEYDCVAVR